LLNRCAREAFWNTPTHQAWSQLTTPKERFRYILRWRWEDKRGKEKEE